MTLALTQSIYAVAPYITGSFLATGGTGPYSYAVIAGGAGGTINPSTGVYTAPSLVQSDPKKLYDTIQVTDSLAATATTQILVALPIFLFCDIIQRVMNLPNGRVYLWDQKINQPTDSDLYIAVSVPRCKPFANVNRPVSNGGGLDQSQFLSMQAQVDIDVISRGVSARDRKEEVLLALNSTYSQQQQEANSFYIAGLSPAFGFINLSEVDGAAIPYRYKISVQMQYAFEVNRPSQFFDNNFDFTTTIDS